MSSTADRPLDRTRIGEVFLAALERQGEARLKFLDEACGDNVALRTEVESLLTFAISGPLGEPVPAPPEPQRTGAIFGDYKILRSLGRGGMGAVYLAERSGAGFTQRVALKLLRRDLFSTLGGTPGLEARFARERQILARLEHPGIARLIDGGYGAGGQPYLAMEYVEGESLTDFARSHKLGIAERLRLFIAVAEAVHYAHQRLVIHCDLKPSNILIPASGAPKLLDFGVAKLVEGEEGERPPEADTGKSGIWFTPSYASPEQVRGERVTTLSDIYSLGVLLYELLTGKRPYEIGDFSVRGVMAAVCERIPERPSTRVEGTSLARELRGDLDTIVLKTLAKEPERRYRSAQALAEDLRRHLDLEPVSARPATLGYRTRTFVRRNRPAVVGAVLALLLLTVGLIATTWQAREAAVARRRAEAALTQSEEVTDFLIGIFQESDPNLAPVNAAYTAQLLERGKARVDELHDQPAVQARLLDVMGQLFLNVGRVAEARAATARSLALRRAQYGDEHPDVAASLQHLGRIERVNGEYQHAELLDRQALGIFGRTTGTESAVYADALADLGFLLPYLARLPEAEAAYREVYRIRDKVLPPEDPRLADAQMRLSYMLQAQGKDREAETAARLAVTLRRNALGSLNVGVAPALINLADVLSHDSTRWTEAEELYRNGIMLQRRRMGDQYLGLVHGTGNLASLLQSERRFPEAESLMQRVLEIRTVGLGPDNYIVAADRGSIADLRADEGRLDEAIAIRREVVAALMRSKGASHPAVAGSKVSLATLYLRRGNLVDADTLLTQSLEMLLQSHGPKHLGVARCQAMLGEVAVRRHQYPRAEPLLRDALAVFEVTGSATREEIERARRNLAAAEGGGQSVRRSGGQ